VPDTPSRPIVFLSDYGLEDEFVGICHAVMARVNPGARVIDLTHSIPPHEVLRGGILLADAIPYLPEDAVVLAVVDPGVGTDRPAVAVRAASGSLFVGPDNGVLWLALERAGGAVEGSEIASPRVRLEPVSATFHGRDVFAPAAAHLSAGMPLERLGPGIDVGRLARLSVPAPSIHRGRIECEVLSVDRFGNVQLSVRAAHLAAASMQRAPEVTVRSPRGAVRMSRAFTFAEVPEGDYALILDARGWLAVVRNGASAAQGLGVRPGVGLVVEDTERLG
jgi:S-adenosylmethionine hydrolase